jgi:hypothetical protein
MRAPGGRPVAPRYNARMATKIGWRGNPHAETRAGHPAALPAAAAEWPGLVAVIPATMPSIEAGRLTEYEHERFEDWQFDNGRDSRR